VSDQLLSGEDLAPTLLEAAGVRPLPEMSGMSFARHLKGETFAGRQHVFAARLTHGSRPFQEATNTHTFDLSRAVRTSRYKLVYNCTPGLAYSPVDSYNDASWKEMTEEHLWGRLETRFSNAYFARRRPVFELYDLEKDPCEFDNLAGRSEVAPIERELKLALQEKMILDWDYLPLPLTP
jgi:arylsulfatase A-like enzyme